MNLNVVFFSCQLVDFLAIFLLREKSDKLGAFNTLSKETLLDVGLLVLPVEQVIEVVSEVVIVEVVVTSDSCDGSRSSSLLTMLRSSLIYNYFTHIASGTLIAGNTFYHIHSSRHMLHT